MGAILHIDSKDDVLYQAPANEAGDVHISTRYPSDTTQPLVISEGVVVPREALAALVLSAIPHLTGDELRRVAASMPRVAGEWTEQGGEWSRCIGDETVAQVMECGPAGPSWEAWVGGDSIFATSRHPTARAAQAACDARLESAGVRLCGEVVRDG